MSKITLEDLARKLRIDPSDIVDKCYIEGLRVDQSSCISAGLAASIREWFSPENNRTAIETGKTEDLNRLREQKKIITEKCIPLLRNFDFDQADKIAHESGFILQDIYKCEKVKYIKKCFFERYHNVSIDEDKIEALADSNRNLLATARAGSGKTRLLTCKTALLINEYGIDPDKILLLAFNKKAAREMQNRIVKDFKMDNFRNARTFHSLAHKLVKPRPEQKILFDKSDEDFAGNLSLFVKDVLRSIRKSYPVFRETMLQFFKKEMADIERRGDLLEDEDYYIFRRNMRDVALKGDRVKSKGEKFIADFLFEHDINYAYESGYLWNKDEVYRPDFTIYRNQKDIVIEHWALDPESPLAALPDHWTKTTGEYRAEMQRKKDWLQWKGISLIETSVADLRPNGTVDTRKHFENILRGKLEACEIKCERLSDKEIANRVVRQQTSRMVRMFVQFIQKSKKKRWSSSDVAARVDEHRSIDQREAEFLKLAVRVYKEYERKIEAEDKIDFDMLMEQSVAFIEDTKGNCSISLGHNHDRKIRMNELEWILIDEYQDFSRQFNDLVNAIRKTNKEVKLFCVGDDWQAINGFAGSDLFYFDSFEGNYLNGERKNLLTNYRSHRAIVEAGNKLMRGYGKEAKALSDREGGTIKIMDVTSKWIECTKNEAEYEADLKFRFYEKMENGNLKFKDNGELQAKYVKTIYEIVSESSNLGKEVAILSRTNNFYYLKSVEAIKQKLKYCFAQDNMLTELGGYEGFDKLFKAGTAHSFKGLQADIVFILKVCEGTFPLVHPDWTLCRVFGENEKTILDEEKRLFYVALTRAREKVYCLTEKGRESGFLKHVPEAYNRAKVLTDRVERTAIDDDIPF